MQDISRHWPHSFTLLEAYAGLTCSSLLEMQSVEHVTKSLVLAEQWELHVDASTKTRPQIGWTGQDEAKVFVPHEGLALFLDGIFDLFQTVAETGKH